MAEEPPALLTEEQIATCRNFCSKATLDSQNMDHLITLWIEAPRDERKLIARFYPQYFTDPTFVARLSGRGCARFGNNKNASGGAIVPVQQKRGKRQVQSSSDDEDEEDLGGRTESQVGHKLRLIVQDEMCKLQGNGPFPVRFGLVTTEALKEEVINLYQTQFRHPDRPELERLVTVIGQSGVRTRHKKTGNFTWYLKSEHTNEIACILTARVHSMGPETYFFELPLCATGLGYTKLGLARLLNASLQEHCAHVGGVCILVSADPEAVPFWCNSSLGYTPLTQAMKAKLEYHYSNFCSKFNNSQLLTWEPPSMVNGQRVKDPSTHSLGLVDSALGRMPKIILNGPSKLATTTNNDRQTTAN